MQIQQLISAIQTHQTVQNLEQLVALELCFDGVASLKTASKTKVSFLAQKKYLEDLAQTQAGLVLVSQKFAKAAQDIAPAVTLLVVKDAYLAHASISTLFEPSRSVDIHPTAVIDATAVIAEGVAIGAYSVIGARVQIGENTHIGAGVTISEDSCLGESCVIEPQVMIAHQCLIGDEVRIHSHSSIGSEGFGFAPNVTAQGLRWQRIAQLGRVRIGNRVRIGSNTCIDRGAVEDTVIEDDVIIDNLVQIAHNVHIGAGTAMAAKVAIAGSTTIGKNCIIGGAVGISGHLQIADGVTITAMSMVINDIKQAGSYSSGTVAMPSNDWRRAAVRFRQLGEK